jgi:penicillin-binding protein 1C
MSVMGKYVVIAVAAAALLLTGYARVAPLESPETRAVIPGTVVLDAYGNTLQRASRDGLRIPVRLEQIAPVMLRATIAAEDRRFQQHPGIDPLAIARALANAREQPSGASTITQQLARRLYLDASEPLLVRKAHEALIAFQLEANRSKREILELYLNDVYYGRGAYGVEAAARSYFGVSAANLDLAHAAYLAGLPQRPSEYDEDAARARQAYVLGRMTDDGIVSRTQADAAARETLAFAGAHPVVAAEFVDYALAELARVRPDLAAIDGLVIETTLDAGLQSETARLARLRIAALKDRNVTDAAVVAIEPGTGRILAMIGGATDGDPTHGGQINMAITPRAPGSALKPFLYAAAFEQGYTPATPLLDVATTFATNEGPYAPLNYDRAYHGVVPLRVALASSLNIPAVRTLDALGLDTMLEITNRFGLRTLRSAESYGLSLTLGGGDVRLLDLTNAYAALGAQGELAEPYAITRVRDRSGRVLYERAPAPPWTVLSKAQAYLMADMLSDADARIPGFGEVTPFELPFPAAVKSGTSTGFRDNWTLGYTPEIAIGVWAGNADGSGMVDVGSVEGAGVIWHDAMMAAALSRKMSWYARPANVVETTVCAPTGLLPGPFCPSPTRELFVAGTEPTAHESYYSSDGVNPPIDARAWASDAGLRLAKGATAPALRIVTPAPGTVFWLAPELGAQRTTLRAAVAPGIDKVTFALDGVVIGEVDARDPVLMWTLTPGTHTLRVSTPGVSTTSMFEVKR